MPTRLTNANGTFLAGLADDRTGEDAQYAKVTKWVNGSPMSDARLFPPVFRKMGDEYFQLVNSGRINVLKLGLKNDGVFRNELILAEAMRKLPPYTEYYFPSGYYLFGPLPSQYNNIAGIPVAIDWGSSGASFTGDGDSTVLKLLPGCVGIQINGGLVKGVPELRRFTIEGSGQESSLDGHVTNNGPTIDGGSNPNPDFNRQLGLWSLHPNNYQYSGINAWAQVVLSGVNVRDCAGHGLWVQGYIGVRPKGITTLVPGTFINSNRFRPDDAGAGSSFGFGTKVELGTAKGFVGGLENNGDISLDVSKDGNIPFPSSGHYTIGLYSVGSDLIADNGVIEGNCNFDFNAGCGIYIQGSDGNQWNMFGGSVRENGFWGIWDRSFLGNFFYGTHGSHNGNHFNEFAVGGIDYNDSLVVGSFMTSDFNARSAWFGCYTEQGNQGPSHFEGRTIVIGGIHAAGITGSPYYQEGSSVNQLAIGNVIFDGKRSEVALKFGDVDTAALRLRRRGAGNGVWGFGIGNSDIGQGEYQIFMLPLPGATVDNGRTDDRRRTRIAKASGPACYASYLGVRKTVMVLTLLDYLNSLDPKDDLVGDYLEVEQGSGQGGIGPLRYRCVVGGASPEYMPDDFGRGTDAQRPPNLLVMDAGWRYFSTTSKTYSTWNGTAWV